MPFTPTLREAGRGLVQVFDPDSPCVGSAQRTRNAKEKNDGKAYDDNQKHFKCNRDLIPRVRARWVR